MSDHSSNRAPLIAVFSIFVLFGLFFAAVYFVYAPRHTGAFTGDGIHTEAQRKENLAKLHEKELKQATSYGWVDQKAGVVQLPLARAQELTLQRFSQQSK